MSKEENTFDDVKDMSDLIDIAKLVVSTLELDQVLDAILVSAMRLTNTPAGSIALYDNETSELEICSHRGFSQDFIISPRWKVRPGGLTDKILRSERPTVIKDTTNKKFFTNPLAVKEGIKSMVCVPLIFNKEIIGIFYVDDFSPRKFSERELRLLYILSTFAAMSIDHAKLHEKTKKLAVTDGLTGLYNHRHFQEQFDKEISRAQRYGEPFSVMMIDIDDFKRINDSKGHVFGDWVLKNLGEILTASTRESDTAARYGGEEFAVIMPKVNPTQAERMAERVGDAFRTWSRTHVNAKPPLTLSIGVACFPEDSSEKLVLLEKADAALYEAKRLGKDRVVRYGQTSGGRR